MSSIAGVNLNGKVVIVRKSAMNEPAASGDRRFRCEGRFGCNPDASGTKVFGTWLVDNEDGYIRRHWVESVVEETKR